jgi:ribosome recycling factor
MKQEDLTKHLQDIKSHLSDELSHIRTGRAAVALIEDIRVEAYVGSPAMPINELATITVPEPQSLLISPWDKTILKKIETAIVASGKGLNPVNEGAGLRINVPMLTEDRRKELAKEISNHVEQAKIKVRNIRQDAMKSLEEQEENGVISEDDMFRSKKQVEESIAKANDDLEEMGKAKTAEVMTV